MVQLQESLKGARIGELYAFQNQPEHPNSYSVSYQLSINGKNRYICIIPVPIQNLTAPSKNQHNLQSTLCTYIILIT